MIADYEGLSGGFFKVEVEDGIGLVTMNRPEALNAMPSAASSYLHGMGGGGLFVHLQEDDRFKVIVVTGVGRGFSAGADVRGMGRAAAERTRPPLGVMREGGSAGKHMREAMLDCDKPIIAAVNGVAYGLGLAVAVYSDIIIAAETARFADTHVVLGLVPSDNGITGWPPLVGPHRTKEYLFNGKPIDGKEAYRLGLANKVVPLEELMPTAKALARRLAEGPRWAVAMTKAAIVQKIKAREIMTPHQFLESVAFTTDEHLKATAAWAEKQRLRKEAAEQAKAG